MSQLKKNIFANFMGQGWSTVLGLVAVPFYIRFLGMEGYGLVGFYTTLQAVFNSFLDFGLSATINREIARYLALPAKIGQTRDLVRTLEVGYWLIGLLLGVGVSLCAPLIARYWIQSVLLPATEVQYVIFVMGILTAIQWPLTFYQGGLIGMEKIQLLNILNMVFSTIRSAGAIMVLWSLSASVHIFFQWQIIVSMCQVGITIFFLWRNLPVSDHFPRIQLSLFTDIWRFIAGMSATSFVSFFLGQADRIILSKILTLEYFGYYTLATTLSTGLQTIGAQVVNALFPRFSSLFASGDQVTLRSLYHKSSQLVTVIILPAATVAAFFSKELIQLWTQDAVVTSNTALIASILFAGVALNTIVSIPYHLVVAYGWTSFGFFQNLLSIIVIVPLMIFMSLRLGGAGAALTWLVLNICYFVISPGIIHRRVLKGELSRWYMVDVGAPVLIAIFSAGLGRWLVPDSLPMTYSILSILFVGLTTLGLTGISASEVRNWAYSYLSDLRAGGNK